MEYLKNYFSRDLLLTGILGYLMVAAKNLPSTIYNFIVKRFSVSIYVASIDYRSYNTVLKWIESLNSDYLNNNIRLDGIWCTDNETGEAYIKDKFNLNYGSYLIKLDTFTFATITKSRIENNHTINSGDQLNSINIRIFGKNKYKYKKNIIDNNIKIEEKKTITIASHPFVCDRSFRSFDSIIMDDDIKKRIIRYIDIWINNKDLYIKNNIPYKTGILLYGEPGTGKSSLARAIASYLKYDIEIINVNNLDSLNPSCNRSIILIEDIDCMFRSREYQDETNKDHKLNNVQLGEILNFIDGQLSPENCIFIATTNHIERLDPALIRPGRFDLQIEMKYLDYELASQMCERFNQNPDDILKDEKLPISPAYLQAKLIENLYK